MRAVSWSLRLLFAAVLLGIAQNAEATVTIELEWGECGGGAGGCTATGSNTIAVNPGGGQTLRLDIYMTHDLTQGMIGHMFSLNFDTDLGNELNLGPMAPVEWAGTDGNPGPLTDVYGPFNAGLPGGTVESTGAIAGRINSYESATATTRLPRNGATYSVGTFTGTAPARYRIGQAYFTTNGAVTDGVDVFSGQFNALLDHFQDGNDVPIPQGSVAYGNASLNLVPEPGTVSLLGLGLIALVAARRSRA
jgi:hypothetical protein